MPEHAAEFRRPARRPIRIIAVLLAACALGGGVEAAASSKTEPLTVEGVRLGAKLADAVRILEGRGFKLSSPDQWFQDRGQFKFPMVFEKDTRESVQIERVEPQSGPVMERIVKRIEAIYPPTDAAYQSYVQRLGDPTRCGGAGPNERMKPFDCLWSRGSGDAAEGLHVAFGKGREREAIATLERKQPTLAEAAAPAQPRSEPADAAKQTGSFAIEGVHGRMRVGEARTRLQSLSYKTHNFHPCMFERAADGREVVLTLRSASADCSNQDELLAGVDANTKLSSGEPDPIAALDPYNDRLGRHSHCLARQRDRSHCVWSTPVSAPDVEMFVLRISQPDRKIVESLSFIPARNRATPASAAPTGPSAASASYPAYAIEGVHLGMASEQARAKLEDAGYTLSRDRGGCGFLRRSGAEETSVALNDGSCGSGLVLKISAVHFDKSRPRARPSKADMEAIVGNFEGEFGEPKLCKVSAVLSNCRWAGAPRLDGAVLAVQIAPWPGGLKTMQTYYLEGAAAR